MKPVIVCIAKKEKLYIEEFIKYHLALGFHHIYLYDNEDTPTYETFLSEYARFVSVHHIPGNNYHVGVQYIALNHFADNILMKTDITHVAHIDIDEFIVLKRHKNISEFIEEYITGDCEGIGMNWRFFGSSGRTEASFEPVTQRFTMCTRTGDKHIKTIFKKDNLIRFGCHNVCLSRGHIKSIDGTIIEGPFSSCIDVSVIQLNHYKCKTLPEFRDIRMRQRADVPMHLAQHEDVDAAFRYFDLNEVEDTHAQIFYKTHCLS